MFEIHYVGKHGNATLVIKSNAGKAEDVSHHPPHEHHLRCGPRNGPSRERRRLRRAAAQEAEKSAANVEPVDEEVVVEKVVAEEAIAPEKKQKMSPIIHLMNITFVVGPAMDHPENEEGSEEQLHKRLKNLLQM